MKTYKTQGTCSQAIQYEVVDGILTECRFLGGCPGNTQGVARLAVGRPIDEVISLLKGVQCRGHKGLHACLHIPPPIHFADVLRGTRSAETHICDEPKHAPIAPP